MCPKLHFTFVSFDLYLQVIAQSESQGSQYKQFAIFYYNYVQHAQYTHLVEVFYCMNVFCWFICLHVVCIATTCLYHIITDVQCSETLRDAPYFMDMHTHLNAPQQQEIVQLYILYMYVRCTCIYTLSVDRFFVLFFFLDLDFKQFCSLDHCSYKFRFFTLFVFFFLEKIYCLVVQVGSFSISGR